MNRNLSLIFISFTVALVASLFGCATPVVDEQEGASVLSGPAFVLFYTDN